jgi:spermidine synthase
MRPSGMRALLFTTVFIIATCGLVYELIAGTVASYLLGDSVTQFSLVIGVYLFAMGMGSLASKYIERDLITWFIRVELLVGLVGGISSTLLFLLFGEVAYFHVVLYLLVFLTGAFVGLEIPLLMRILKDQVEFRSLVANIFTFDYVGALLASVIFPLVLMPYLGILRTSYLIGLLNVAVGLVLLHRFKSEVRRPQGLQAMAVVLLLGFAVAFALADRVQTFTEGLAYSGPIIHAESTPYQRIVVTREHDGLRLYLNGNLQFSTYDEYRYHEALVHPAFMHARRADRVLVLGGGDGLALREVLKHKGVQHVDLVDLDPAMTRLFSSNSTFRALNQGAFQDPRVAVHNADAFIWLRAGDAAYDVVIIDFPDPNSFSLGKLYTTTFYRTLQERLHANSVIAVQSTSPFVATASYWCIHNTLRAVGLQVEPYHVYVPSFGDWGFFLASPSKLQARPIDTEVDRRFLDDRTFAEARYFPRDMAWRSTEINRLNNQALVRLFEEEWSRVGQ